MTLLIYYCQFINKCVISQQKKITVKILIKRPQEKEQPYIFISIFILTHFFNLKFKFFIIYCIVLGFVGPYQVEAKLASRNRWSKLVLTQPHGDENGGTKHPARRAADESKLVLRPHMAHSLACKCEDFLSMTIQRDPSVSEKLIIS